MSKIWQELDKLKVFVAVAEKGKINEASEVLNLTQPSVTRAIQKLETAFGFDLFIRSREGVKLTKAGSLVYEVASKMLRQIDDVQVRAQNTEDILTGRLNVGTYESLAEYLWPDFLIRLQRLHPNLQISVRTSLNRNPLVELISGRIDLLVDAEPQTKSTLTSWRLYSDRFAFYVSIERRELEFNPETIRGTPIILVREAFDENGMAIEDHLEKAGYEFDRHYSFDSFSTVKRLASRKMGIAALPIRLAQEDESKRLIKRVSLKGLSPDGFGRHTIYATVGAENEKDPRIKKLVSLLRNHFK